MNKAENPFSDDMDVYRVALGGLIRSGLVTRYDQLFLGQKMPRAAFAHVMGLEPKVIYASIKNAGKLSVEQIYRMAGFFQVDPLQFLSLVTNQVNEQRKEKSKK